MADQWEEAAKQFKQGPAPATSSSVPANEDWKLWQQGAGTGKPDEGFFGSLAHSFGLHAPSTPPGRQQPVGALISDKTNLSDEPIVQGGKRIAGELGQAYQGIRDRNPYQALEHGAYALPFIGAGIKRGVEQLKPGELINRAEAGTAFGTAAQVAPMVMGDTVSGMVERPAAAITGGMQNLGEGIINRTIGATDRNFQRGKNPGAAYFNEGLGPSMSTGSIAAKSGRAKQAVGQKIGSAIDTATQSGVTIPSSDFAPKIMDPIRTTRGILQGPGGGSTASIDTLENTFRPTLSKPTMTPRELFDVKNNVAKNTPWGETTDIGLKQTRQQIAGGLSEPLETHVPDLSLLNPRYADVSELNKLAKKRAVSSTPALATLARRGTEAAVGAGLGIAAHNPLLALAPMAIDTVPVRTTVASGLGYGGRALDTSLPSWARPAAAVGSINNKKPKEESDEQ